MAYMDKQRAESERRRKGHEAKLGAYQNYEKQRAAVQAGIHTAEEAAMRAQAAKSAEYKKEHEAKLAAHQKYEKQRAAAQGGIHAETEAAMQAQRAESERRHREHVRTHREYEKDLGNGKYQPRYG